jgi:hypothetical protein
MHETWTHQLETWHEFYILVGTAGLTLTGLLFVVVSLRPRFVASRQATGVRAFVSPNAVYFTTALVVSAFFLVPDLSATVAGAMLCLGAGASLLYLVYTRAHQQWRRGKLPPLDWVWFVGLPLLSYLLLLLSGAGILVQSPFSIHGVAASLILLIIIGIRNAWDLVLWISQQEQER